MQISRFGLYSLLALVCGLVAPAPLAAARNPNVIKADYATTIARLDQTCDWQFCQDRELRHAWALAGEWLAAYLDDHPAASAADLKASLADLDPHSPNGKASDDGVASLRSDALDLGTGDFVVALTYFETGTFFVVGRSQGGGARVKWSIDAYAASFAAPSRLRCWKVDAGCGPLYAMIVPLPPADGGRPRFYVQAGHAGNGMTIGAQTSVWVWTGTAAQPLAVIGYSEMIDDGRPIELAGSFLNVPIKEDPEGFYTSGAGADPRGVWRLRITPGGVRDLGHHWSDPELHWFDRLFTAIEGGRDTTDLAAPEVARPLKLHAEDLRGMLMNWSVQRGPATVLQVTLDDATYSFTLTRRGNSFYATAVTINDGE
jgi:hypothetical protein